MDARDFVRGMLDEPDEEFPRRVFADWLEETGQGARAEWVRASCDRAPIHPADPDHLPALRRENEAWRLCKPEWWDLVSVPGVGSTTDRGLINLEIKSKAAATRLGKIPWIGRALEGGWLGWLTISWSDDEVARAVMKWKGGPRELPLSVRPAPQISDEALASYLQVPHLWGLDLTGRLVRSPVATRVGDRPDLRNLRVEVRNIEADPVRAIFEQVGRLVGLRRLVVGGRALPTDADLGFLDRLENLRHLSFSGCVELTDAALDRVANLSGLRHLILWGCEGLSPEGVERLGKSLPALKIDGPNFDRD